MVDVLLVEESLSESALACIAIALRRPHARVAEARNLSEAKAFLDRAPGGRVLVILGWGALRNGLEGFFAAVRERVTVIGIAADVGEAARERALRLGVQAIYEKSSVWSEYVGAMESILGQWLTLPAEAAR